MGKRFVSLLFWLCAGALPAQSFELSTSPVNWGGHLMIRYGADQSTGSVDTLSLRQAYLQASYQFDERLNAQIGFFADKFGSAKEALRTAFLDWRAASFLRLNAGRIILPTSREHASLLSDLEFINRSRAVSELFKNEPAGSDLGLKVLGRVKFFDYAAAMVNGAGDNVADDTQAKTVAARLAANWPEFGLAGYGYFGDQASGPDQTAVKNRWGGEMRLGPPEFPIRVEYHRGQDGGVHSLGWFIQAETILPLFSQEAYEKLAWLRTVRPALRFERWDPDIHQQNDKESVANYAINWYPTASLKIGVEYNDRREEAQAKQISNNAFAAHIQAKF